jgi:hypothetical protein
MVTGQSPSVKSKCFYFYFFLKFYHGVQSPSDVNTKTPLIINLLGELACNESFLPKKCRNFINFMKKPAKGTRKLHSKSFRRVLAV